MPDTRSRLIAAIGSALTEIGADAPIEPIVEPSAKPEFGDWSTPAPLRAARILRRPPMVIAEDLRTRLEAARVPFVRTWSVSPPGYVNAHLDDQTWAVAVLNGALSLDVAVPLVATSAPMPSGRTLVEHTNINTNKAAHVGHLRNACLGDTVARMLRRTGHQVEVNNYIDDTGVQVADIVVGIRELGIAQREQEPFDQYCSRVYVEVCRRYEDEPTLRESRRSTLHAIETGNNDTAHFVKQLAQRIVAAHLATMRRFDIEYDLLTWESDIIALGFWQQAFARLRDAKQIVHVESGKNAGCWVLPSIADGGEDAANSDDAKILVKSDGVATYTAKDIAYQLWKFGLLGRDFGYRRWDDGDERSPFTTTSVGVDTGADAHADTDPDAVGLKFGHAVRVINVIDARQAYLQNVVKRAIAQLGHLTESENSIHLDYEVVALSASAATLLGITGGDARTIYAFSGRKGIEVRADDLLDRAVQRIAERTADADVAREVAYGAVRYYLQRFSLSQIIAFDFDEALRTTGDTGVYLQYAHARAAGILRKVADDDTPTVVPVRLEPSERALLHRIEGYRDALGEATAALAPNMLAAYAFSLASSLSDFYERIPPIVREEDVVLRRFRRRLVAATKVALADALNTLGMPAPEKI